MLSLILISLLLLSSDAAISYVPPTAFQNVPRPVIARMTTCGCVVPQSGAVGPLQNVLAGHFVSTARTDYAVLCSRKGESSVLVINGRSGLIIARLNPQPDAKHVSEDDGHWLFNRWLATVSPDEPFCLLADVPCPCTPTRLDGIADVYEKWSETHCWKNGWHTVLSGD